jgi:hypothetical protein
MTEHLFVTTWSKKNWELHGKAFLKHYLANVPAPLHVFHEQDETPEHPLVTWHKLADDPEWVSFTEEHQKSPWPERAVHPNRMAWKFCHKVFAITSERLPASVWRVWLDADVLVEKPMTVDDLRSILPDGKDLVFLGRERGCNPEKAWPETGFVGYRVERGLPRQVLAEMRRLYVSRELMNRGQFCWHDAAAFEFTRELVPRERQHNLSEGLRDLHVWPKTLLQNWMTHLKGDRKRGVLGHYSYD